MQYFALGIRGLIGAVFLAAFLGKVAGRGAFGEFAGSVRDMRLLPAGFVRPVARLVVGIEGSIWLLLAIPVRLTGIVGLSVAAALLGVFAIGVHHSVRRDVRTPCRCFGRAATPLGPRHVARNVLLGIASAAGALGTAPAGPAQPGGAAVAVAGGVLLGLLIAALDDVVELFRPVTPAAPHSR